MLECIYRKDNIELMYDIEENVFYIRVGTENVACCTQDYTKEELINLLKGVIDSLGGEV